MRPAEFMLPSFDDTDWDEPGKAAPTGFFDEDFDTPVEPPSPPEPEIVAPVFSLSDLEAARAEAWDNGRSAGLAEAETAAVPVARKALADIAAAMRDARDEAAAIAEASAESIARLVMDSLATAFPALCARHGDREVRAIVRTLVPSLHQEPMVTLRVNPHSAPAIAREIEQLDPDMVPKVRIVPTDAVQSGDIRIAWRNGDATRDTASLWRKIADVLEAADFLSPQPVTTKEVEHVA